jgi:hypothetical protein
MQHSIQNNTPTTHFLTSINLNNNSPKVLSKNPKLCQNIITLFIESQSPAPHPHQSQINLVKPPHFSPPYPLTVPPSTLSLALSRGSDGIPWRRQGTGNWDGELGRGYRDDDTATRKRGKRDGGVRGKGLGGCTISITKGQIFVVES